MDGQTERANVVMEQFFRCYGSYQQGDWAAYLSMVDFSSINHISETKQTSPFLIHNESNSGMSFEFSMDATAHAPQFPKAFTITMKDLHKFIRLEMDYPQDCPEQTANNTHTLHEEHQDGPAVQEVESQTFVPLPLHQGLITSRHNLLAPPGWH